MSRARPVEPRRAEMLRLLSRTRPAAYLAVVVPVLVVMAATVLQPWLPPSDLLRDSQAVAVRHAGTSPAYGLISNLGILVLALACGAVAVGWVIARDAPPPWPRILLWTGALTLLLALDDLLLLHESVAFAPGSGALVAAAYGLAFLRFAARFRDVIIRDLDVGLLLITAVSLGVSLVVDVMVTPTQASVVVEDGAKLLGLVAWAGFGTRTALIAIARSRTGARPGTPPLRDTARR